MKTHDIEICKKIVKDLPGTWTNLEVGVKQHLGCGYISVFIDKDSNGLIVYRNINATIDNEKYLKLLDGEWTGWLDRYECQIPISLSDPNMEDKAYHLLEQYLEAMKKHIIGSDAEACDA